MIARLTGTRIARRAQQKFLLVDPIAKRSGWQSVRHKIIWREYIYQWFYVRSHFEKMGVSVPG